MIASKKQKTITMIAFSAFALLLPFIVLLSSCEGPLGLDKRGVSGVKEDIHKASGFTVTFIDIEREGGGEGEEGEEGEGGNKEVKITEKVLFTQKVAKNGKVKLPEHPKKSGYTFGWWFFMAAPADASDPDSEPVYAPWDFENDTVKSNMKLYANWSKQIPGDSEATPPVPPTDVHTVVYFANGGEFDEDLAEDKKYTFGSAHDKDVIEIPPPDPERKGYRFDGWYTSTAYTATATKKWDFYADEVTKSFALYARWIIDYEVGTEEDKDGNTTSIIFTFTAPVTGLQASHIAAEKTGTQTGVAAKGALTPVPGTEGNPAGTVYKLAVTVSTSGFITVSVKFGDIDPAQQIVRLRKSDDPTTILYNLAQVDGASNTADTTAITITFDEAVQGLEAKHLAFSGTADIDEGELTSNTAKTVYTLEVTVTEPGTLTITIDFGDVDTEPQSVLVHKVGTKTPIEFSLTQVGGASNTADTTAITITFDWPIEGLVIGKITAGGASGDTGEIVKGLSLTSNADNTVYTLGVASVPKPGIVTLDIDISPYAAAPQEVVVFKKPITFTLSDDGIAHTNDTKVITITFNEPVLGLQLTHLDFNEENSAGKIDAGALNTADGGLTYTLAVTSVIDSGNMAISIAYGYVDTNPVNIVIDKAPITFTLDQVDGADGTADTTAITITFNKPVPGLLKTHLDFSGTGTFVAGTLDTVDGGTTYTLTVTSVSQPGAALIAIDYGYVDANPVNVTIYKAGTVSPASIDDLHANGEAGVTTTTSITITFNKPVPNLDIGHLTITADTGAIVYGALTGSSPVYTLAVTSVTTPGSITIAVNDTYTGADVDSTAVSVTVHKAPIGFTLAQVDGVDGSATTASITITFSEAVTGLLYSHLTIGGTPGVITTTSEQLDPSNGGLTYTLKVDSVTTAGNITIAVNDTYSGAVVNPTPVPVTVYKAPIGFTLAQVGGTTGTADTTAITITFTGEAVTGLLYSHLTIGGTPGVITTTSEQLDPSNSGLTYTLKVDSVTTAGNITITINYSGVVNTPQPVGVFKNTTPPPSVNLDNNSDQSVGLTAGNQKITGLANNKYYKVIVGGAINYVKSDGTLTTNLAEIAFVTNQEIVNLTNDTTYTVNAAVPFNDGNLTVFDHSAINNMPANEDTKTVSGGVLTLGAGDSSNDNQYGINLGLDTTKIWEVMRIQTAPTVSRWDETGSSIQFDGVTKTVEINNKSDQYGIWEIPEGSSTLSVLYNPIEVCTRDYLIIESNASGVASGNLILLKVIVQ